MKVLVAAMAGLVLAACGGQPAAPVTPPPDITVTGGTRFELLENQQAVLERSRLHVRFVAVLADNRCPVGMLCAEPGYAVVRLTIGDEGRTPITLDVRSDGRGGPYTYRHYNVDPMDLQPGRPKNGSVGEYRFALRVRGIGA